MVNKNSTSSIYHTSMKYKPYETHKSQMGFQKSLIKWPPQLGQAAKQVKANVGKKASLGGKPIVMGVLWLIHWLVVWNMAMENPL